MFGDGNPKVAAGDWRSNKWSVVMERPHERLETIIDLAISERRGEETP